MNKKAFKELDIFTFGKTPAALYLVKVLNELKEPILAKKVGRFLSDKRRLLDGIEESNKHDILSASQVSALCVLIRNDINFQSEHELVNNLCNNLVKGEISSLLRRAAKLRVVEQQQTAYVSKVKKGNLFSNKMVNSEGLVLGYLPDMQEDEIPHEKLAHLVVSPKYHLDNMSESVTPETLSKKWKARMERTGKMKGSNNS